MKTESFGTFLQDWLEAINLPKQAFADVIGVDRTTVSEWVHGRRAPSQSNHQKVLLTMRLDYGTFASQLREQQMLLGRKAIVEISQISYDHAQRFLNTYRGHYAEPTSELRASSRTLHASSYITSVIFLHGSHRDCTDKPLSRIIVDPLGNEKQTTIFNEAIVTRYVVLNDRETSSGGSDIHWNLLTSGTMVNFDAVPGRLQLNQSTYEHSKGAVIPATVIIDDFRDVLRTRNIVILRSTIVNGFQKGYERMDAKLPFNLNCDEMMLSVDFGRVADHAKSGLIPTAQYLSADYDKKDLDIMTSHNGSICMASYEEPGMDGTISMRWSQPAESGA